jgi:hypothetical protein
MKFLMARTWASRVCWLGAVVFSQGALSFAVALEGDDLDEEFDFDAPVVDVAAAAIDNFAW